MKRHLPEFVLVLVSAFFLASGYTGCSTVQWDKATWIPGDNPIQVLLEPSLSECWKSATVEAVADINRLTGRPTLVAIDAEQMAVPAFGQILVTQGPLGNKGCPADTICELAGWAQITSYIADHIMAVKLTLTDHQDLCSVRVASHEIGHAMGLGHRPETGSMMNKSAGPGPGEWHPESIGHLRGQR